MLNISELDSVRPPVSNSVQLSPAEWQAYCAGWYARGARDLAVAELGVDEFELRERMRRAERKHKRGA